MYIAVTYQLEQVYANFTLILVNITQILAFFLNSLTR